jgi:TonB-linked SusC/RagA family outer membrane protein
MAGGAFAQTRTIKGKVVDATNQPIIGASIQIKGTSTGTITDVNGSYSVNASAKDVLVISFIGYTSEQEVVASRSVINVMLKEATVQMNDVVITALGIKKERKGLGYSVDDIKSEELLKNKNVNVINSLDGKVAGVNVTQSSGSAGSGASISIRGGTSLDRDNQPLFVVDGIIYDNSTPIGGNSSVDGMQRTATTFSNRVMDINPEDIETMSILKGAAASALYGSRAANGVVVITTKKGSADGNVSVSFSSKLQSSWVNKYPEEQSSYQRGYYNQAGTFSDYTMNSWGQPFSSSTPMYDNIKNFFQTGTTYDNSVNVSGGNKNGNFFLSMSRYDQTGIVPTTGYNKTTVRFNGEQKYGKLTVDANMAYSIANTDKTLTSSGLYGGGGNGAMTSVYTWARSDNMKQYLNADGSKYRMFAGLQPLEDDEENPYWILNEDKLTDQTNRYTGSLNADFKVTDWFDIMYRAGLDRYTTDNYTYIAPGSAVSQIYQNGRLSESEYTYQFLNSNFMLSFHKKLGLFDTNLLLGQDIQDTKTLNDIRTGWNFTTPGTISFSNIATNDEIFQDTHSENRLMGLYGEFRTSYKSIAYLTLTGRNDWTSTLPVDNRSYFYPSVSGSFVFTELIPKNNILSFGKVRASWARVGQATDPYATNTYLWAPAQTLSGLGVGNNWTHGNPYLKPEITQSSEFGTELKFLNGRIGMDYTYYFNKTYNQILQPRTSQSTGYIFMSTNAGDVTNRGMELSITGKPIVTKDFKWDVTLNISGNRGKVNNIIAGLSPMYVTDVQVGNAKAASFNGGAFMGISGSKWSRDAKGNVILDWVTSMPTSDNLTTYYIGNREPKFVSGLNNSLQYKNWNLSFLIDVRVGGAVYNGTDYLMTTYGMSPRTVNRESLTLTGVALNPSTGQYEPVTRTFEAGQMYNIKGVQTSGAYIIQNYYSSYYPVESSNFMTNTNWFRLRSVSLTYSLPSNILAKQNVIKALSVSVIGTNLLLFTNYKGMDPESSAAGAGVTGSSSVGIDYAGVPATAGCSVGLNVTF